MSLAYFALILAIVSASILEIAGAHFSAPMGMAAAALGVLAASLSARKADYDHYLRAVAWTRWFLVIIPVGIALQLLPVWLSLAHPIWASAREAVGGLSFGFITADVGLTLNALALALSALALIGVTILVSRDRGRAELILFVLGGVTTVSALVLILHRPSPTSANASSTGLATTLGGLGLLVNLAVMQLAAERAETHHALSRSIAIGLCGLVGALICGLAVFGFSSTGSAVGATFGIVLVLLILLIRRLDLSAPAVAALSLAALVGAAIVLAFVFEKGSGSALLRLAPDMAGELKPTLERMLADTRWFGAGAGAFAAVSRIYQSDPGQLLPAPSVAAAIFVDMGWVGLVAALAVLAALLLRLFFGALARGRDSFFPAAAAACLSFTLVEAFSGPGLLRPAAIFCLSAIAGLGLSQSIGQSSRS
ncbi:hypothetical protein JQ596_30535 [Bradyrhizobium manausense]|uniref:hypothetical protein n=1 Tax=Bradyrhizobium manausense TaxID=989370 RepID=UPI001BAE2067|nr:hypothetical protein [Bradyrhizobium manausense]MBR0829875.1 hypothetical protein [Bradyrhizobium manausense]